MGPHARREMSKEEREERDHFERVVAAFRAYQRDSKNRIAKSFRNLKKLPLEHQKLLSKHGFTDGLDQLERCVELNDGVLSAIIADAANMFENASSGSLTCEASRASSEEESPRTAPMDVEKIQSTLKQLVRDWSEDGAQERELSYEPILRELKQVYSAAERSRIKVLVPGAGLGRLAYDIARLGFESQGNEFSLYMLFAANFVLNKCKTRRCHTVYPWIHQFTNNFKTEDVCRPHAFPDVNPGDLPEDGRFSMVAGDFLEVYADPDYSESWDCVVTCFFLDCAHNVLDFIQLIYKILKPGGRWINLGPLLYHFADIPKESSIEPSYDVVRHLIKDSGFTFVKEETGHRATYCQNPKSMLQYHYDCVFFTCFKPAL